MRRHIVVVVSLIGFLAGGCRTASVALTEGGRKVQVYRERPAGKQMEFLKDISCKRGMNGRSPAKNQKICEHEVRNEAAKLQADLVVVQVHHEPKSNYVSVMGTAYDVSEE